MNRAPHALYIAWGFPPCRGSGVYRALATANALAAGGFDVTVLTCDRETFFRYTLADTSLEERVDPRIDVVRIPFEWPVVDSDIRRWSRRRARHPREWLAWRNAKDQKEFPEVSYGPWLGPLVAAAEEVNRRRPVDVTVATANPNVTSAAAYQLHRDHGIPFVLDQRDSWSVNVFDGTEHPDPRVHELEEEYISHALEAWFVNEPLREVHAARYPEAAEKIHSVSNGYDPEFAPEPRLQPAAADQPLSFGFIGTVTSKLPLAEFAAGWVTARAESADLSGATASFWGHLGFLSSGAALGQPFAGFTEAGLVHRGPVAKEDVRKVFDEIDVLLLVLGAGRFVTSGKVFEYMASGLPIVSVQGDEGDASRVLTGYPLWFPAADLGPRAVADALLAAAAAAREAGEDVRRRCVEHAATYERSRQLAPRVEAIRARVSGQEDAS